MMRAVSVGRRASGVGRRMLVLCALLTSFLVPRTSYLEAQTHVLIVSGLGGDAKFKKSFATLADSFAGAAVNRFGIPANEVTWLGEDSVSKAPRFKGQSTKVNVERWVQQTAARAGAGDQVIIVLIGHGSGDAEDSKLSMPGPDLSARDFATLLAKFPTQKVAFVNLSSASGDMIPILSGPNRVIITATKSSFERNESHFADYFVRALTVDGADTDKDGRISLLEAFQYATTETKRLYENDERLQSEHAQLDDDGDKTGHNDPDGKTGEGMFARRFFFDAGTYASRAGANDPRLTALYTEKFAIEDQINTLRSKKASMTAEAYDDELEKLLVQLALKARTIREIEGRKSQLE